MLDPTLNTYALAVAAASGLVAAGMHGTTVLTSSRPPPARRVLVGQLIRTAVVGAATSLVARWLPWRIDIVAVLIAAAIVGGTLGPRGLWWYLQAAWSALQRVPGLGKLPDLPAEPPESPVPAEEAKPHD